MVKNRDIFNYINILITPHMVRIMRQINYATHGTYYAPESNKCQTVKSNIMKFDVYRCRLYTEL